MSSEERFKYIRRTNKQYIISDRGRVYSKKQHKWLKPQISTNGYVQISISRKEEGQYKYKRYTVSQLVAEAFFENYEPGMKLIHKDGNLSNNCVDNLMPKAKPENVITERDIANEVFCLVKDLSCLRSHNIHLSSSYYANARDRSIILRYPDSYVEFSWYYDEYTEDFAGYAYYYHVIDHDRVENVTFHDPIELIEFIRGGEWRLWITRD